MGMGRRCDLKDGNDALKWETQEFRKNMEEHFLEGKKLRYQHTYCCNVPRWTKEQRKRQAQIIRYFLQNPHSTYKEVWDKFWVDKQTVWIILKKYPKIKMAIHESREKEILDMYESVLYDIAEITQKNISKYKETDEKLRTNELKDLSSIAKDTQDRKNLMEGKPTENQSINITIN